MAILTIDQLKSRFERGDFPRQQDFWDLIDTLNEDAVYFSTSAPDDEATYKLWFNTSTEQLSIFYNNSWIAVGLDPSEYYTSSQVDSAIAAVVASAPGTLDTLNELAAALGDDANFAGTVTTALGNKQDKVSGVSDTEIGYLDGVTSAIQTQLSTKAPTADPTFTGTMVLPSTVNGPSISTSVNLLFPTQGGHITLGGSQTTGNLTLGGGANRTTGVIGIGTGATTTGTKTINVGTGSTGGTTAITLGSSSGATSNIALNGNVTLPSTTSIGNVSATEIGYLDGVTSAIQTQIDGKAASSHSHAQSDITNLTTDLAAKVSATNGVVTTASTSSTVVRNITLSTSAPSGGSDGDVWLTYTA